MVLPHAFSERRAAVEARQRPVPTRDAAPGSKTIMRQKKCFVVLLNGDLGAPQAVKAVCREWAHTLTWTITRDRLSKLAGLGRRGRLRSSGSVRERGYRGTPAWW